MVRKHLAAVVALAVLGIPLVAVVAPVVLTSHEVEAKSTYPSPYGYEQTWNAALRLVRVDMGMKILEKDEKAGYILFEYIDKKTASSASIELFRTEQGERGMPIVQVMCSVPKFPSYHESVILNRLSRKLKDEYGQPPEVPRTPIVNKDAADAAVGE